MKLLKKFFSRNRLFSTLIPTFAILLGALTVRDFKPSIDKFYRINVPSYEFKEKYNLIDVPTYNGYNQVTHPKVIYVPEGWNGYKYWMCMTPYQYAFEPDENPSIVASQDGTTWVVPTGLINPISGIPADAKEGGHYSDPHIVIKDGVMELWYRYNRAYTPEERKGLPFWKKTNNQANVYYRQTSKDGVQWSEKELMLEGGDGLLSLVINYEDGKYKAWYSTYSGELIHIESPDAKSWSSSTYCQLSLPEGERMWHQDIIRHQGIYYSIQTVYREKEKEFYNILCQSSDGIHFEKIKDLFPSSDMNLWKDVQFYRSTLYERNGGLEAYISVIIPNSKYYLTHMKLDK